MEIEDFGGIDEEIQKKFIEIVLKFYTKNITAYKENKNDIELIKKFEKFMGIIPKITELREFYCLNYPMLKLNVIPSLIQILIAYHHFQVDLRYAWWVSASESQYEGL